MYSTRFISNTSHIFVINWPSISKLGEVIEKDTFFPGKQETFIYVWKSSDNNMVQVLSPGPTENSGFYGLPEARIMLANCAAIEHTGGR